MDRSYVYLIAKNKINYFYNRDGKNYDLKYYYKINRYLTHELGNNIEIIIWRETKIKIIMYRKRGSNRKKSIKVIDDTG